MYHPIEDYAKLHQAGLLDEVRRERSLRSLKGQCNPREDQPGLRDRILILVGDWLIAFGHRLHHSTRSCTSQSLSEGKV